MPSFLPTNVDPTVYTKEGVQNQLFVPTKEGFQSLGVQNPALKNRRNRIQFLQKPKTRKNRKMRRNRKSRKLTK